MNFINWFHQHEGFGLRSERFYEDECNRDMSMFLRMQRWMELAYQAGQENRELIHLTLEEMHEILGALEDAVYLLNPTEEDMQKKTGIYRVVTALEKLKEKNA